MTDNDLNQTHEQLSLKETQLRGQITDQDARLRRLLHEEAISAASPQPRGSRYSANRKWYLQASQLYKMRSRNKQQVLFPCGGNGNTFMPCQAHKSQPLCPEVQACPTLPAGNSVWASLYTEPGVDLNQVLQEAAAITN